MARKRSESIRGVFKREYYTGAVSYGIDYIHPITGQRVRKILKDVTSEEDALKVREIELTDARRGAINQAYGLRERSRAVAFVDMVDEYLEWSRENKKSWKTDESHARALKKAFARKLMSDINPFVLEKYKVERSKTVKKNTVNKDLILGSQVFEKAAKWGKYNGPNPFLQVNRFKIPKGKKPGYLTPEEVAKIRDAIDHPVKRDMVTFAFHTGWRISEIRKLKWEDVDLEAGRAWIVDPKNRESVEIVLSTEALRIIQAQRRRGEFVFCKLNGSRWKTSLPRIIKAAAQKAGVKLPERKIWHIFRRTWASMMLQNGCDVETLRVLGNWKTASMPLWYADAAGVDQKKKLLDQVPSLDDGPEMAPEAKVVNLSDRKNE